MKVVIVGAGVIGMMQARELALRGVDVVIIDKSMAGTESSWAGGGIVSPLYPWRYSPPVTALSSWSQSYYPNLVESLEAECGIDPELTRHGLLVLSVDDKDQAVSWSQESHAWLEEIQSDNLRRLEPHLNEEYTSAFWMSKVASIRTPRLAQALRASLQSYSNVEFIEESPVSEVSSDSGNHPSVLTSKGERYEGDAVVVASGAWTSRLLQNKLVKVEPVKGQMILIEAEPGIVNRVVLSDGKYVIPRRDGLVLVGSTLEYCGFDKQVDAESKELLSDIACTMFPSLARFPIVNQWSGLRPGSPNGVPYIGELPDKKNVFVNAGHFRNGLVLAPASVRLLADTLLGETPPIDPTAYAIDAQREA